VLGSSLVRCPRLLGTQSPRARRTVDTCSARARRVYIYIYIYGSRFSLDTFCDLGPSGGADCKVNLRKPIVSSIPSQSPFCYHAMQPNLAEKFVPLIGRQELPLYAEADVMEHFSRRAIVEIGVWAARFKLLAPEGRVLEFLLAAPQRPFGRLYLSTRSARKHDLQLRAAFCVEVWRNEIAKASPLTTTVICSPCSTCGHPTGCWCDDCSSALCTRCEREGDCGCASHPCSSP
jgi:hypothetical protein